MERQRGGARLRTSAGGHESGGGGICLALLEPLCNHDHMATAHDRVDAGCRPYLSTALSCLSNRFLCAFLNRSPLPVSLRREVRRMQRAAARTLRRRRWKMRRQRIWLGLCVARLGGAERAISAWHLLPRERDPSQPSAALLAISSAAKSSGGKRRSEPSRLVNLLRPVREVRAGGLASRGGAAPGLWLRVGAAGRGQRSGGRCGGLRLWGRSRGWD